MIGAIVVLTGLLLIWVGLTDRGNSMWNAVFGKVFTPLGFGTPGSS